MATFCECNNKKPLGSINGEKFLGKLSDYQFLNNDFAPVNSVPLHPEECRDMPGSALYHSCCFPITFSSAFNAY